MASPADDDGAQLEEELEAVEAILMDGVQRIMGEESRKVQIRLDPLTASEEDKKYVSLFLEIDFPAGYPDRAPDVQVRNPRGLLESAVSTLLTSLKAKAEEFASSGAPVIFELVEQAREFLTESNHPACNCAICLNDIVDGDSFRKTPCEHYFHTRCLGRYAQSSLTLHEEYLRENPSIPGALDEAAEAERRRFRLVCPVCRAEVPDHDDAEAWLGAPPPVLEEHEAEFQQSEDLKKLQAKMSKLYLRQRANGGIIDMEEEGRKFLVTTTPSQEEEDDVKEETQTGGKGVIPASPIRQPIYSGARLSQNGEKKIGGGGGASHAKAADEVKEEGEDEEEEDEKGRRRKRKGVAARGHYSHRQSHYYQHHRRSHHTYIKEERASAEMSGSSAGQQGNAVVAAEALAGGAAASTSGGGRGRGHGQRRGGQQGRRGRGGAGRGPRSGGADSRGGGRGRAGE